jgi:plastocyanin
LFLAFVYSVVGALEAFLSPARLERIRGIPRTIPVSALLVIVAVGFVLGGASIGAIAAHTESSLALSSHGAADITIVMGSSSPNNAQFYSPANYTMIVGSTVTWVNHDDATHTVTENNGLFDSGPLPLGASFSYTFTQPGTYHYSCAYHPWMMGTIVVTAN